METHEKSQAAYEPPAVVYEAALEVRAGSPIPPGMSDLMDVIEGN
jgi:hypothetical protein